MALACVAMGMVRAGGWHIEAPLADTMPCLSLFWHVCASGQQALRRPDAHLLTLRLLGGGAEAMLQALAIPETEGRSYAISSTEGEGPGGSREQWRSLFLAAA